MEQFLISPGGKRDVFFISIQEFLSDTESGMNEDSGHRQQYGDAEPDEQDAEKLRAWESCFVAVEHGASVVCLLDWKEKSCRHNRGCEGDWQTYPRWILLRAQRKFSYER